MEPLHRYFFDVVRKRPDATAVVEPGHGSITYRDMNELSDRTRDRLRALGVSPGDRVGIYVRKSIDSVAAIYGILKLGAAYVPVDPGAPPARNAFILNNCGVRAVVVEDRLAQRFEDELAALGPVPTLLRIGLPGGGRGLQQALDAADRESRCATAETHWPGPDDLAYILYTSGSTGKPKGVMLSHRNAVTFVDWCSEVFEPSQMDRFSSHAPFHFDLSILDIHVCLKHGATLVLVREDAGKDPNRLAALIADEQITIWYSAPSILALLAQFGNLHSRDFSKLRQILFAGEVFPVKHLRTLVGLLPGRRYFNLYGPTETNVCTWFEIPLPIDPDRTQPFPIGRTCSHLRSRVVDESGRDVQVGDEGELCIAGPGVMKGYWALPEQSANAFYTDSHGIAWYRTGDIVVETADDIYIYRGRRDRMVKRRGYRVELGEIEAGLYRHRQIKEAAVVAAANEESGVQITAFLSAHESQRPSLIELKRFCSENLPLYMVPDRFVWLAGLPKTSTDKIDYQQLKGMT